MGDIFISYANADRTLAESLANRLTGEGFSVWWDRELIGGEDFQRTIEEAIHQAKVVMPIWSESSRLHDWVRGETHYAKSHGMLTMNVIVDRTHTPLGFSQTVPYHLFDGSGSINSEVFRKLVHDLHRVGLVSTAQAGSADNAARRPEGASVPAFRSRPKSRETPILLLVLAAFLGGLIAMVTAYSFGLLVPPSNWSA